MKLLDVTMEPSLVEAAKCSSRELLRVTKTHPLITITSLALDCING